MHRRRFEPRQKTGIAERAADGFGAAQASEPVLVGAEGKPVSEARHALQDRGDVGDAIVVPSTSARVLAQGQSTASRARPARTGLSAI
jgi:hypothetical protein